MLRYRDTSTFVGANESAFNDSIRGFCEVILWRQRFNILGNHVRLAALVTCDVNALTLLEDYGVWIANVSVAGRLGGSAKENTKPWNLPSPRYSCSSYSCLFPSSFSCSSFRFSRQRTFTNLWRCRHNNAFCDFFSHNQLACSEKCLRVSCEGLYPLFETLPTSQCTSQNTMFT